MYSDTKNLLNPQDPVEIEPRKRFWRFAEAMRRGILVRPKQAFGVYERGDYAGCALQAIHDGGMSFSDPELRVTVRCPSGKQCLFKGGRDYIGSVIFHLNDDHRWKRERIADWLENLD